MGAIPLEHNPHIMLGHEMIHALRFRYGLDKPFTSLVKDHMTVSIYANDLLGMKNVIGELAQLVIRYYGIENSRADISFDSTNHKISEFQFDPKEFIFKFTSKAIPNKTRPLISYQKDALIDSLKNFERALNELINMPSLAPNTLDFVRCNLDLLLGLLTGEHNDTNAATAIERSSSAEFQSQLKKLYSQYNNDRKILKLEVCTQLNNSMLNVEKEETIVRASAQPASSAMELFDNFSYIPDDDEIRYKTVVVYIVPSVKIPIEEAETTGCQVNESDLDPKCPYTESLLRRESRSRETGIEVLAYRVTTAP